MEKRIILLNKIQETASNAWIDNGGLGTILSSQRTGKFIISFKCIYKALELGWIKLGDNIRYRGEVNTARRKSLFEDEREACKKILGKDIFSDFNITYCTYQAGIQSNSVVVEVFDEVDLGISQARHVVIKDSPAKYKLGLTGTVQSESNVFRNEIDAELLGTIRQGTKKTKKKEISKYINKGELLEIILPIVFEYPYWKALADGIVSPFETTIVSHQLGTLDKYLKPWKTYDTLYNERDFYYKMELRSKMYHLEPYVRKIAAKKNVDLLYHNMRSKSIVGKLLLDHLDNTIVFSVGNKLLEGVTENITTPDNVGELIDKFRKGEINNLATCKLIARGTSIPTLENAIFLSYYGKATGFLQKVARISTFKENKVSKLFLLITEGTYEEKWAKSLTEIRNSKGDIIHNFDLNIKNIISSRSLTLPNFKL